MAFGKKSEDPDSDSTDRYVVDHVPVMISGKKFLQSALNSGDAKGWHLIKIINSDKHDWILIVWERPKS